MRSPAKKAVKKAAKKSAKKTAQPRASASTAESSSGAASAAAPSAAETPQEPSRVTVRFYCQGIGDCHLLSFPTGAGKKFHMLIDCGIHRSVTGGNGIIDAIVDDIATVTERLDVIVLTHEHWDHISGFFSAQQKFKDKFSVGEIWMGWTENPDDPQAVEFDKYKQAATDVLVNANRKIDTINKGLKSGTQGKDPTDSKKSNLEELQGGLDHVLGFVMGAKGEKVRKARDALVELLQGKSKPKYLEPKVDPLTLPGVDKLSVYVLGPPRQTELFGITERTGEMYGVGSGANSALVRALANPFAIDAGELKPWSDVTAPFDFNEGFCFSDLMNDCAEGRPAPSTEQCTPDESERNAAATFLYDRYMGPDRTPRVSSKRKNPPKPDDPRDQNWRRIDGDWLGVSANLGIQLDKRTNNSSLVLAFEFGDTGHVLLFVGDAQAGNWLSWKDVSWKAGKWEDKTKPFTAHDLLARTVFYKVGHHGSHNATLKQQGLELMVHPDLAAFVPTNKKDADAVGWHEMPFEELLEALNKSASKRVVKADDEWLKGGTAPDGLVSGAIKKVTKDPSGRGLYVELELG